MYVITLLSLTKNIVQGYDCVPLLSVKPVQNEICRLLYTIGTIYLYMSGFLSFQLQQRTHGER